MVETGIIAHFLGYQMIKESDTLIFLICAKRAKLIFQDMFLTLFKYQEFAAFPLEKKRAGNMTHGGFSNPLNFNRRMNVVFSDAVHYLCNKHTRLLYVLRTKTHTPCRRDHRCLKSVAHFLVLRLYIRLWIYSDTVRFDFYGYRSTEDTDLGPRGRRHLIASPHFIYCISRHNNLV
jgi:hypothetical protein